MKAHILTIALAASAFALVSCKPKVQTQTIEENVSAGADKIAEGVNEIVEAAVDEVEPAEAAAAETAPTETPAAPAE